MAGKQQMLSRCTYGSVLAVYEQDVAAAASVVLVGTPITAHSHGVLLQRRPFVDYSRQPWLWLLRP